MVWMPFRGSIYCPAPADLGEESNVSLVGRFCLVAVGAIALVALGGATVASGKGVVLCKANQELCQPANRLLPPTPLTAELKAETPLVLENSLAPVECKGSTLKGEFLNEGSVLEGEISSLEFKSCKSGTQSCSVSAVHLPFAFEAVPTGKGNGTMTFKPGGGKATPGTLVQCGLLINCTFVGEPQLAFNGGEPASLVATKAPLKKEGGLCPESGALTATFTVASPASAYASNGETRLCDENGNAECAAGHGYAKETTVESKLESGTKAIFEWGSGKSECTTSSLEFETGADKAQPLPLEGIVLTFGSCSSCSITASIGTGALRAKGGGDGKLSFEPAEFQVNCGANECSYRKASNNLKFSGGQPAKVFAESLSQELLTLKKGSCAKEITWTASYELTSPKTVYVTG